MKRFETSRTSFDPNRDDFEDIIGEERNSSIFPSSPSNSKAVLAALRALQDKIRRLESERSQALEETANLRNQLSNFEIESEHRLRKETIDYQRSIQDARNIYDKLLSEKDALEQRFTKLEAKCRESNSELDDLNLQYKKLESEKYASEVRLTLLERELESLQNQLQSSQQHEQGNTNIHF